jgi:hypothetical protein
MDIHTVIQIAIAVASLAATAIALKILNATQGLKLDMVERLGAIRESIARQDERSAIRQEQADRVAGVVDRVARVIDRCPTCQQHAAHTGV